ncbi:MAG: VIT and VWA domain-containing protein, partial [Spirochaetes bacterium]|nr:VIT and VWA domain-containing protein [Spirochaetota bacterium]
MGEVFGMLTRSSNPVPLVGVNVTGDIVGRGARVKLAQRFRNTEGSLVEAVYRFPLPEGAAVCGFTILVDGKRITSTVEEREKAFEIYDKAIAKGDGAYLLDEERPNIFTLSVGNLNPGAEAVIEIEFVNQLDGDSREGRFVLPTTISPRYLPKDAPDEDGIPATDRIHPEYAAAVPYGLSLEIAVHDPSSIESVESPSHAIKLDMAKDPLVVRLASDSVRMDRDFVLTINWRDSSQGRAYRFNDGEHTFVQLDLLPPAVDTTATREREVTFLLDCSGSMQGDSIDQAKKALRICLKALPSGCLFNVMRFGSSFESMFPQPKRYDPETLKEALAYLDRVDADLGGTEVLAPLAHILSTKPAAGGQREVILLTDGQVGNEAAVMKLIQDNAGDSRFFAVGIGAGPNQHLIKGLVRAGQGASEFIFPGERIEPKVLRIFQRLTDLPVGTPRISWKSAGVEAAPLVPTLFQGTPTTVFARSKGAVPETLEVSVEIDDKPVAWTIPVVDAGEGRLPIPTLWARERIRDLEESKESLGSRGSRQARSKSTDWKDEVIAISRQYGVLSESTSYVAVEEREEKDKSTGELVLRKVPSLVMVGWHGVGSVFGNQMAQMLAGPVPSMQVAGHRRTAPAPMMSAYVTSMKESVDVLKGAFSVAPAHPIEKADTRTDLLMALLSLQRADAGFDLDQATAKMLGFGLSLLEAAVSQLPGDAAENRRILSTAIVLAVLEQHFAAERSMWSAVTRKS